MNLTQFYRHMNEAVNSKEPSEWFNNRVGLCTNLSRWCDDIDVDHETWYQLKKEMQNQFVDADLDYLFPFNQKNGDDYYEECKNYTVYQNEKRLKWIHDHV